MGFKAVYTFIPNPLSNLPDIGKCTFETGGFQDFIGTSNITEDRLQHSLTYDTPIDCVWSIRADKGYKIYLQFPEYQLDHPNDCHINYIQVHTITLFLYTTEMPILRWHFLPSSVMVFSRSIWDLEWLLTTRACEGWFATMRGPR